MRFTTIAACAVLIALPLAARAGETPQITTALETISRQAQDVASGRVHGKGPMRSAARAIALNWQQAERILVTNPDVIVETKIANRAIRQYETVYAIPAKAKKSAQDVVSAITSLQTDMQPPSPAPSTGPSAAASTEPSAAASTEPSAAASPAPSATPSV